MLPSRGPFWETAAGQRGVIRTQPPCFQSSCSSCSLDTAAVLSPILALGPRLPGPLLDSAHFPGGGGEPPSPLGGTPAGAFLGVPEPQALLSEVITTPFLRV